MKDQTQITINQITTNTVKYTRRQGKDQIRYTATSATKTGQQRTALQRIIQTISTTILQIFTRIDIKATITTIQSSGYQSQS